MLDLPPRLRDWTIPPTVAGPVTEARVAVLIYQFAGSAVVNTGDIGHRLTEGDAIWIPPGVHHRTRTDPGGVVVPVISLWNEPLIPLPKVRTFGVPRSWRDWMIHRHIDGTHVAPNLRDGLPGTNHLCDLATRAEQKERPGDDIGDVPRPGTGASPLPRTREAANVARTLLHDPKAPLQLEDFADRERISVKALQRQFRNETNLSFSEWRARSRVAAAARHLADGHSVGQARHQVGYTTAAGFTEAFHRHTGTTPREYLQRFRTTSGTPGYQGSPETGIAAAKAAIRQGIAALTVGAATEEEPPTIPDIPLRRPWVSVRPYHFLLWMYRGEAEIRIGARIVRLRQCDAVWIPAGVPHIVGYTDGSIAVPFGMSRSSAQLDVDELEAFSFPEEAETFLLHRSVVEYTLSETEIPCPSYAEEVFRVQFLSSHETRMRKGLVGSAATILEALCRNPADSRSLADWALHFRSTPEALSREFLEQTGETFPRWRAQIRMDLARVYLSLGEAPGGLSKKLGYSSPAAFANAFSSAHGMSAREYQRRER